MKRYVIYAVSGLLGLVLILAVNATPLAKISRGRTLPLGWQNAPVPHYKNCTPEEQLSAPAKNNCSPTYAVGTLSNYGHGFYGGFPFAQYRYSVANPPLGEFEDENDLAGLFNGATGVALGLISCFTIRKVLGLKSSLSNYERNRS